MRSGLAATQSLLEAAQAEAAGLRPGGLERALLFEHEREVARLAELAQKGGFQPLYPTSAATLRETEGYLALLLNRTSDEVARVAAAAHALLLRYLEWKESLQIRQIHVPLNETAPCEIMEPNRLGWYLPRVAKFVVSHPTPP